MHALLKQALISMNYDPEKVTPVIFQDVACRLSVIAGKEPVWSWRYLHNVYYGKLQAGKNLLAAIEMFPSLKTMEAEGTPVLVIGDVKPGALILADSRRCANPACNIVFVPKAWNQLYYPAECKKIMRKLREKTNGRH